MKRKLTYRDKISRNIFGLVIGRYLLAGLFCGLTFLSLAENPVLPAPPSNDDLCDAIPLTVGASCAGFIYTIEDATTETDEDYCSESLTNSVWFSFVAPPSATVYITTTREFPGSISLSRTLFYEDGVFDCTDMLTMSYYSCTDDGVWEDTLAVCGLSPMDTYWIQVYGSAVATESDFCIEVHEDAPDAGPDQELCDATSTTLDGSSGPYYEHYWDVLSGTATITDDESPTSSVTGLVPGETVEIVRMLICGEAPVAEDTMVITNYEMPVADAGANILVCEGTMTTLGATVPLVGSGEWSITSGSATITDPFSATSGLTDLLDAYSEVELDWTVTNGTCVDVDGMRVENIFNPSTDAGPDQHFCEATSTFLEGNIPEDNEGETQTGLWTINFGTATLADATLYDTEVTGLITGVDVELVWTITSVTTGCVNSDTMQIIFDDPSDEADAGPDQLICEGSSTTLEANTPISGTGMWTVISGPADVADPTDPVSPVDDLGFSGTTNVLEWAITSGSCVDRDTVEIVYGPVEDADAGPDQYLCDEVMTTLDANYGIEGDFGYWTLVSGTATIVDDGDPNTDITGLIEGDTIVLEWSLSNGFCTTYDTVIIFNSEYILADAGSSITVCEETSVFLDAIPPSSGTGMWSVGFGTADITDPSSPTTEITGMDPAPSAVIMYWEVTNGACVSEDFVYVSNAEYPSVDAGPDQELCDETSTFMNANSPFCGKGSCDDGLWTLLEGSATIADVTFEDTEITDLIPGTTVVMEWTITGYYSGCVSSDTVIITIDEMPIADAGENIGLCEEYSTTLDATPPGIGTGMWSVGFGVADITDPSSPTSGVTGLAPAYSYAYLEWTVTNGSCSDVDEIAIIVDDKPAVDAGPDQELCDETMTVLEGNEPLDFGEGGSQTGLWTTLSGSCTIADPTLYNSSVSDLIPGTTVELIWTITSESLICTAEDTMTITIYELPTVADAGMDQVLCDTETATSLEANAPSVGTGMWTILDGIATISDPSSPTTMLTGIDSGVPVVLRWTISNGTCPPSMDDIVISFDESPSTAEAGPDQELCNETMTVLAATIPLVGTGQWYLEDGTATIDDPFSPTSLVTDLVPGDFVLLIWEVSNGTCPVSFDEMFIYIDENPTTADAGPDQDLCGVTSTFIDGNVPSVGFGLWSIVSGTGDITNPESPSTEITGMIIGSSVTLEWTIENGSCPPSVDQLVINVDEAPTVADAGLDQELCDETMTSLSGNTPVVGTGMWSVSSGTATIADPASPTSDVTGLIPGETVVLEWSITNGVCPVSSDEVEIINYELPTIADAGLDQELCDVTSTFLEGNIPVVGTGLWTVVSGVATIVDPDDPETEITDLIIGDEVTLEWTISNGTCPETNDQVTISVDELATVADAGPDQVLCNVTTTFLEGNVPEIGNGQWTVVIGIANLTDPASPFSEVTDLIPGESVVLEWSIENGVCPITSDEVVIQVDELPTIADAGPDQQFCNLTETFLEANSPEVGSGLWSLVEGDAFIVDPEDPNTELTDLIPGTEVVLQWEIVNGVCPASNDEVIIIIDALPSTPYAGPDQLLCDQLSTFLEADEPLIGMGEWSIVDGTATIVSPADPNSELIDLEYGTTVTLEWTVTNETCPSESDQVVIDIEELPTEADAGPDQELCGPTSTFLEGNTPVVGEGYWLKISGPGLIVDPELPNSELTGLEVGMPTICQWTIFGVNCPASTDYVTIETSPGVVDADAGPDQQICNETSVFMAGNLPMGTTGEWSVVMGTATIIDASDPLTEVTGFNQGETVIMQWAITPEGCSPSIDQMSIFVNTSGFVDAGPDQALCDQLSTIMAANTPDSGEGMWNIVSGQGNVLEPMSPVSMVEGLNPNAILILEWMITDGDCLPSRDTVAVETNALPSEAMAGEDLSLCASTSTMMNASVPLIGSGEWSVSSGNALVVDPLSPNSSVINLIAGENVTLKWTVSNGPCPQSDDEVEIINYLEPSLASAGEDQVLCTETEATLNANTPAIGTGTWSVVSGTGTILDPSSPGSMIIGLMPGTPVTIEWSIVNGPCPPSSDTVMILWHEIPDIAMAGDDQLLCKEVTTTLEAVPPLIGEGFWTIISGVGTVVDPTSPNSELTDLVEDASVTLHWTVTNATCPPSIDDVTIQVDVSPSPALAGPDFKVCDQKIVKLAAESPAIGEGEWSVISGSAIIVEPSSPTSQVMGLVSGTTALLQWSVSNGACEPSHDTIFIEVDESPSVALAGDDQQLCGINSTVLEGNVPDAGQGMWSIDIGSGTLSDPTDPGALLSDLIIGSSITLSWTISNGVCPSTIDQVEIHIGEAPTEAMAGDDQNLCDQTETMVNANIPVIGNGEWETISGSGMLADPFSPATQINGLSFGVPLVLQWVITEGNCVSYDTIIIFPDEMPTAANAGEDQVLCSTETLLNANSPVTGTGEWSIISGTGTIADPGSPNSSITGITPGSTVVLSWTIMNACGISSDEVSISSLSEQPIAVAGDNQILCEAVTTTMNAVPANIGDGTWTVVSGMGTIINPSDPNTEVVDLLPGSPTVLRWTVDAFPCPPAIDDVTIEVDESPSPANAGADATICDTTIILTAEIPTTGDGEWQILSGPGTLDDSMLPDATLSELIPGEETVLTWTVANGVCPSSSDTISIAATPALTMPDAGADEVYCNLPFINLDANEPLEGTGEWSIISGSGVIADPTDPNSSVTGLGIGDNEFVWTISNNACDPLSDTVTITNTGEQGLEANFLVSEVGCIDTAMYMFDISNNDIKPTEYLWDFGDNTTSTERDPVHTYTAPGDYTISMTTFLNGCASAPARKDIKVFACAFGETEHRPSNQIKFASVFPNPTNDDFNVSVRLAAENDVTISVFQADGQLVTTRELKNEKELLTTFYAEAPGCYFVRIEVKDEVIVFKVLKIN